MKIYNSFTFTLEDFKPIHKNKVGMYVCGPTVYDVPHLGHARSEVSFDLIRRYLEFKGYKVNYVHNYTDIDDKMIKRANKRNIEVSELAEENIRAYEEMQKYLMVKDPTHKPRATEEVDKMIEIVETLEEKGFTYTKNGNVYFDTSKVDGYEEYFQRRAGEEDSEFSTSEYLGEKKNKEDFVLWKKKKKGEPSWDTKWGEGRPGWHLECSVMSLKYIGDTIDIHGGGIDLKQPHHKNEIAQSEAATGKDFCKYWLHNGFLNIDNEKMSKSLGNFIRALDLKGKYPGNLIRYFLLSNQYRSTINFSEDLLAQAKKSHTAMQRFYKDIEKFGNLYEGEIDKNETIILEEAEENISLFFEAMDTDFNTAEAFGYLFKIINAINPLIYNARKMHKETKQTIQNFLEDINDFLRFLKPPQHQAQESKWKNTLESLIEDILDYRTELRKDKKYQISDKLRAILKENNIEINDNPDKSRWFFRENGG